MKTIKIGDTGKDVIFLQNILIEYNYKIICDGIFGQNTEYAVKDYQKLNNLKTDGIVGKLTWNSLINISENDYIQYAKILNVEVAVLKAVKDVESNGKGLINNIPTLLFEGHIFWKQLEARNINPTLYVSGNENILYNKWTKKYYSTTNQGEYKRLLKAINICSSAAYESASYGLFQILGINYKNCNVKSAKELYDKMCLGENIQMKLFVNFLLNTKLYKYLQTHDWKTFAKLYNGPCYSQNKYDIKLQNAYNKYK